MQFTVNGTTYELVQKGMTFAEARAFEKVSGYAINEIQGDAQTNVNVIQGMLWISMKRVTPTITFGELDDIAMDQIEWIQSDEEKAAAEEDPSEPAPSDPDGALELEASVG